MAVIPLAYSWHRRQDSNCYLIFALGRTIALHRPFSCLSITCNTQDVENQNLLSSVIATASQGDLISLTNFSIRSMSLLQNNPAHLCGNLDNLTKDIESYIQISKNGNACQVWGIRAFSKHGLCDKCVCYFLGRGEQKEQTCFAYYCNKSFFRLAKTDYKLVEKNSIT